MKKLKPEVTIYCDKWYHDEEVNFSKNWTPEDPTTIDLWVTISVGQRGSKGTTNFYAHIITPNLVSQYYRDKRFYIIPYYDDESYDTIMSWINNIIFKAEGGAYESWQAYVEYLATHFHWEYDNYRI